MALLSKTGDMALTVVPSDMVKPITKNMSAAKSADLFLLSQMKKFSQQTGDFSSGLESDTTQGVVQTHY